MTIYIYGLFDIRKPDEIKYVGQTECLSERWKCHRTGKDAGTREWVKTVELTGGVVSIRVLEEASPHEAGIIERKWIMACPAAVNERVKFKTVKDFCVSPMVSLREMELQYIRWAIEFFDGNKQSAAKALGVGRQTLYNKLKVTQ